MERRGMKNSEFAFVDTKESSTTHCLFIAGLSEIMSPMNHHF